MTFGLLTLYLHIPGCKSLKEKRRRLKPLLFRLRREFNISVAEVDQLDMWQDTIVACAFVSNDRGHTERSLQDVARWIENNWPDLTLIDQQLEIL